MILETIGGVYGGMALGLLISFVMWYVTRAKARRIARARRSLPYVLTRHIVGTPPDLDTLRFPLIQSHFLPHVTSAALYRPASTPNLPARLHEYPNNIAYYESVPESDADAASLVIMHQRCFIGTIDEHVFAFRERLELMARRLLVQPRSQSVALPEPQDLLGDQEDSPPLWLDALQRTALALYWADLKAIQAAPSYARYREVFPADVANHPATRRYDELLRTRAAPYQAQEQEHGPPGDNVAGFYISLRELEQDLAEMREQRALDQDAAGLRYLALTDCSSPAAE